MSNDNDIEIRLSANADQVSAGMGRASAAVGTGTAEMQSAMLGMVESIGQAIDGFKGAVARMAADHNTAASKMKDDAEKASAGLNLSFSKMSDSAKAAASQINGSLTGLNGMFTKFQGAFLGLTAVLAGGAAFKGAINASNEWTGEVVKLSKALGITTERASILNVALQHLGIDSDTYMRGAAMLSRQINSNAQAFDTLGVKVKDSVTGGFRPVSEVMSELNQRLVKIKNPIEQNIAGTQVYGRAWQELKPLMKLTADQMAEAEERAKRLNLVVGAEGASQSKVYKEQMRDLSLVGRSLEIQFGNALMPVFSKMGAWMANESPGMGEAFKNVLLGISAAAQTAWLTIKRLGEGLGAYAAMAVSVLKGDWDQAKAIYKENLADGEEFATKLKNVWRDAFNVPKQKIGDSSPNKSEGLDFSKTKGGGSTLMADLQKEMTAAKAAQESAETEFIAFSKQQELAFWEGKKSRAKGNADDEAAIALKIAEIKGQLNKESSDGAIKLMELELGKMKGHYDEQIALIQKIGAAKEHEAAADSIKRLQIEQETQIKIAAKQREAADAQKKLQTEITNGIAKAKDDELAMEQEKLDLAYQLGQITLKQKLASEVDYQDKLWAIKLKTFDDELALLDQGTEEYQKALNKKLAAEAKYQLDRQKLQDRQKVEDNKPQAAVEKSAESGISSGLTSVLMREKTAAKALQDLYKQTAKTFLDEMITKPIAQMMMKAATDKSIRDGMLAQISAFFGVKKAQEAAGDASAIAGSKATALGVIPSEAAIAAGGAASSVASIPYVGPAMAAAAYAETMAMVMSGMAVASAAGGFDIPAGMNPVTQLHEKEMVLPAEQAGVIRDMAGGGGGGRSLNVQVNATPMGKGFFMLHQDELVAVMKDAHRKFSFTG